jgi:hypothetical protein
MRDLQKAWLAAERTWRKAGRTRARHYADADKRVQELYAQELMKRYEYLGSRVTCSNDGKALIFDATDGSDAVAIPIDRLEAAGAGWVAYITDIVCQSLLRNRRQQYA